MVSPEHLMSVPVRTSSILAWKDLPLLLPLGDSFILMYVRVSARPGFLIFPMLSLLSWKSLVHQVPA